MSVELTQDILIICCVRIYCQSILKLSGHRETERHNMTTLWLQNDGNYQHGNFLTTSIIEHTMAAYSIQPQVWQINTKPSLKKCLLGVTLPVVI